MKFSIFIFCTLLTLPVFAKVTFAEKSKRIEFLLQLQKKIPALDTEVYLRELQYEKLNLNVDERAGNEARFLSEQIKKQVVAAYEAAIKIKSHPEAYEEIQEAIERDSELMSEEIRDEIKKIAFQALQNLETGHIAVNEDLDIIKTNLLKSSLERFNYLNLQTARPVANINPSDVEKINYKTRAELLSFLVSDKLNSDWVSTAGIILKSHALTKKEANIDLQVRAEFLGTSISAGPVIAFTREYISNVTIMAEGMNPVLLPDGQFDFNQKDRMGRNIIKNGKPLRRFMIFNCNASLKFANQLKNGGGLSIAGIGADLKVSSEFENTVGLESRRMVLPETIENRVVTLSTLSEICMQDFLKAPVSQNMTVSDSLNVMMKNIVSSLRYSHPKTKCSQDTECRSWFNTEVLALQKTNNVSRCIAQNNNSFFTCELRGQVGQNCPVIENGKRISDGKNEYTCDNGLGCVKYQMESFFFSAKGKCQRLTR